MKVFEYGNPSSDMVLIQMTGEHESGQLKHEYDVIREKTGMDIRLVAMQVNDWNRDLSPWEAPAVFGKESFEGRAEETFSELQKLCTDHTRHYYIGGYSLAGLFALWVSYQTDIFEGVAAASPSVWFPEFREYMQRNEMHCGCVYLSLGDREEKTRNPVMATVGEKIREIYDDLKKQNKECILEWNQGNHFKDADLRTAAAFSWILRHAASA